MKRTFIDYNDPITSNEHICLDLKKYYNTLKEKGYTISKDSNWTKKPKKKECLLFPEKDSFVIKILNNKNKTVRIYSILEMLNTSEESLLKALNVKELTREVLEGVVTILNEEKIKTTIPKAAIKEFLEKSEFKGLWKKYLKSLKFYSAGGYLVNNKPGKMVKDVYVYDINSYFPAIAYNQQLPYKVKFRCSKFSYERYKDEVYFVNTRIKYAKLKENRARFLTFGVKFRQKEKEEEIIDVRTTLSNLDVEYIYENYENVDIEFFDGEIYETRDDWFKGFVDELFKEKNKHRDDPIRYYITKLKINTFLGKIGSTKSTDRCQHLPLHRYLLSYSRINLCNIINELIEKFGAEAFHYADTDSIHCSLTPEQFATLNNVTVSKDELGAFKLEHYYEYCYYYEGYKSYIGLEKSEAVCKLCGIPYDSREPYVKEFNHKLEEFKNEKDRKHNKNFIRLPYDICRTFFRGLERSIRDSIVINCSRFYNWAFESDLQQEVE